MHRFTRRVGLCAALVCLAAGCGAAPTQQSAPPSSAGPTPTSADVSPRDLTVSWANDYCGAVSELVLSVSEMPAIDASSPRRASETSGELLEVVVGGLDRTVDRLENLDAAPVVGADRVREQALNTYGGIRDRARAVLDELHHAEGVEASRKAVSAVREPLDDIGALDLLDGFDAVPELREASSDAPACRTLTSTDAAPRIDSPGS
ncbi:hypothetical protein [Saccharomonospora sp. NB11]|jgi:hypothetical protein|uniref:hypothetical protein n=1 Tax=Saccharomonospora sp. NB11 TaxID=1642298 RepID=UPI0018D0CAAE|nr:hypothetical protein [Saccharomonospora sp. NB11]